MASVSKIFKPRRGLASTMAGAGKKDIVLQKGEFFLEAPSGGMGTGASKVKVGDGTTAYSSLPYALGDTSNDKIDFSSNTSTTVANALTSVASGNALKTIIGGLKQAISLCNTSITKLNDDTSNIKTYVGDDGLIHFIDRNGADTVLNFNKGIMKLVTGTFIIPGTGGGDVGITITLGFKPDFLFYIGSDGRIVIYDSDYSTTQYRWGEKGYPSQSVNFGSNKRSGLYSINDDGFTTMGSYSNYSELYYATKYS